MNPSPSAVPTASTIVTQALDATNNAVAAAPGVMEKIPKMVDDVLGVLAQRFGSTGIYLWKAIVKYQFANGLADILVALVIGGLAFFMFKVASKHYKTAAENPRTGDPNSDAIISGLCAAAFVVLSIISVVSFRTGVVKVVAPEGSAIHMVLDSMHNDNSQTQSR